MLLLEIRFLRAWGSTQWNTCTADLWVCDCIGKTEFVYKGYKAALEPVLDSEMELCTLESLETLL